MEMRPESEAGEEGTIVQQGEDKVPERTPGPRVVGIGASAGGLEALERLFRAMPVDTGMAFVVIQHLSPDFKSLMDELLARHTSMAIHRVRDGMPVDADSIYLIPPRKEMIISGGRLLLTDKDPEQELSLPIDHFFRSMAHECGSNCAAVVLSGTGSDGSRGIRDVHAAGGLVVVQNESTAKFDGMPKSALDTGLVDYVLAPEEMPLVLADNVGRKFRDDDSAGTLPTGLEAVMKLLRDEHGIDFSHYKPNTVGRRIDRRLSLSHSAGLDAYVERLRNDPEELNSLYRDLLIGVTRFFRDSVVFERLEHDILPKLLARKERDDEVRIWVAGCATGEEAYSMAILVDERLRSMNRPLKVKIFATDVHRASLEVASAGVYRADALMDLRGDRLARYFTKKGDNQYQVDNDLRQTIVFAVHNLIKDAPFTKLDLISCRNLLIYLQPPAQKKVLSLFHFGLRAGGILLLGPSETPGDLSPEFEDVDAHWKMYRKRRDVYLPADLRLPSSPLLKAVTAGAPTPSVDPALATAYDRLLEKYMPAGVLVNERHQLVHTFGDAGDLLVIRSGRVSGDVLELVHEDLKLPLAGAIARSMQRRAPVEYGPVRLSGAETDRRYRISIEPLFNRQGNITYLFIALRLLNEVPAKVEGEPASVTFDDASRDLVRSLESDLSSARENLQATIEELETSNEEMQATNEELVASNEELQSTNEELHSVNEELYTVNAEYQKKIVELTQLTDDIDNLLRSTDVATIFLDRSLCIRKFTPQIGRVFDLLPHDVGRRIDSFSYNIQYGELLHDLEQVNTAGVPIEKEVQDRHGNWFFLRVLPYRSHSEMAGVVLSLIDISPLKKAQARFERERAGGEEALRRQHEQYRAIFESVTDALLIFNARGELSELNPAAARLYGYSREELIGSDGRRLFPADGNAVFEAFIQQVSSGHERFVECTHLRSDGGALAVQMSGAPFVFSGERHLLAVVHDVTEQKRAQEASTRYAAELEAANAELRESVVRRREAEQEAREAVDRRDRFLAILSHELRNPLAAIMNASRLLECAELDETSRHIARGAIARQSEQMARLLDDLLDVSRITRNKIEIRKSTVDLRESSRDALDAVRPMLEARQQVVHVDLPPDPLYVDGDPARLMQIQVNLLTNAGKYTPQGGSIWLSISADGGDALIRVRDSGAGIPTAMRDKIFELFVQLDTTVGNSDGGMGVGLTLVRTLVHLHGGRISVRSDGANKGSEFEVRLPLVEKPTGSTEPRPQTNVLAGLRVLVVEDQPDIRVTTERLLTALGCQVSVAEDGPAALELLTSIRVDLALVDIGLPGLSGYELAPRMRQTAAGKDMLMIALTGFGQPEDRAKALGAGFDAHFVKPIGVAQLTALIEQLRRPGGAARQAEPAP